MFSIEIHDTINQIIATFYRLRFWDIGNRTTIRETGLQLFHLIYFASFVALMAAGACISIDKDEYIFLTVAAMINGVIVFKMANIIWKRAEILSFIHEICNHRSINDLNKFNEFNSKLKNFMIFAKLFIWLCVIGVSFALFVPLISAEKKLVFNIALPSDWKNNKIVFWLAHIYIIVGCTYSSLSLMLSIIIWYVMINSAIKYERLEDQLRNLGVQKERITEVGKPTFLLHDLIEAIRTHLEIIKTINQFATCFGKLFFLQISTSGICICGSIYTLAFSNDRNFLQNGVYCVFITYSLFDIFMLMYMGNDLKLSSDRLSYCLFESNWIDETQTYKKYLLILAEVLKKPHELVIGKLYPLNLKTFTKILNGAYSMFNILKNVK